MITNSEAKKRPFMTSQTYTDKIYYDGIFLRRILSNQVFSGRIRVIMVLIFSLMLTFASIAPQAVYADERYPKIVRVGWYDSSYNYFDEHGRRSGYAYEYQVKLSSYNGWNYQYVEGSWPDLLQML
jgi:hypothetical protein